MANHSTYTPEQIEIIKRDYVSLGGPETIRRCNAAGPYHTDASVRAKAKALGACRKMADIAAPTSDHIDRLIKRAYSSNKKNSISTLAFSINRTIGWISRRADQLDIDKKSRRIYEEKLYSEEERSLIQENAHLPTTEILAKLKRAGFDRTYTSLRSYRQRVRFEAERESPLSQEELAGLLGIAPGLVSRFILKGMLPATRVKSTKGGEGLRLLIDPANVAYFIVNHPAHVDLSRVDRFWFIDLMAHYGHRGLARPPRIGDRVRGLQHLKPDISMEELASALECSEGVITTSRDKAKGVSEPKFIKPIEPGVRNRYV